MANDYYSRRLSADRLRRCYEIAPPRVRQYLDAEIAFVADRLRPADHVLELGCGYGRVLKFLADRARTVIGIDTSHASLCLAHDWLRGTSNYQLAAMNAAALGFADRTFDVVVCIQNGLSAFHVDRHEIISESIRVTRSGGLVLLSTYSEKFWEHRLAWFRLQAAEGLIGEIDEEVTRDGVIACKDGFRANTITRYEFLSLTDSFYAHNRRIEEVDDSSVFCELVV